jgi:hypothetical protein
VTTKADVHCRAKRGAGKPTLTGLEWPELPEWVTLPGQTYSADGALIMPDWLRKRQEWIKERRPRVMLDRAAWPPFPVKGPIPSTAPAPATSEPAAPAAAQDRGGRPDVYNWLGVVAVREKEEKAKGRPVRFDSRKDAEEWIANNVRRVDRKLVEKPPGSRVVKKAIKRHRLDVALGFSELS